MNESWDNGAPAPADPAAPVPPTPPAPADPAAPVPPTPPAPAAPVPLPPPVEPIVSTSPTVLAAPEPASISAPPASATTSAAAPASPSPAPATAPASPSPAPATAPASPSPAAPAGPATPAESPASPSPAPPIVLSAAELPSVPEEPEEELAPRRPRRRFLREAIEFLIIVAIAVALAALLKVFVVEQYSIPTGSMAPTIEVDDRLFAEKVSYYLGPPAPGDIVTFDDPIEEGRVLIKRCIAVGGQTVDLIDGRLVVDGVFPDEPYTYDKPSFPLEGMRGVNIEYPYIVPDGMVWVMGDNRTDSLDSRYFGPVPEDDITGKAFWRFLPFSRFGPLD